MEHNIKPQPSAIEIEKALLGACLYVHNAREAITYLRPEHFYLDAHQTIWKAIQEAEFVSLKTITHKLKAEKTLERVGGAYYLTLLSDNIANMANLEYMARIIQQMFIKREMIRISSQVQNKAHELSTDPIDLFDDFLAQMQSVEEIFAPGQSSFRPVSGIDNEMLELEIAREGQRFTGLSTGYQKFDEHFRFKPSSFVIVNGHDNVGKTFAIIHMAVCANHLHGWKWVFACLENSESRVRQDIIQAKTGKHISQLSKDEFLMWYDWAVKNFIILRLTGEMTADRLLAVSKKIVRENGCKGLFIDPYNALILPATKDKHFNSHEYHYEVTTKMRNWIKQTGCCIYLSTHAVTEALRNKHRDGDYAGYPMPPQKADVEGGGKFANRADDFITIHRYTNHPTENNVTHIHVRKIKDTQTGGRPTIVDDPVKLRTVKGYFGLFDEEGNTPLFSTKLPPIQTNLEPDF